MYASLTTTTSTDLVDNVSEVAEMAAETMVAWLREIDGFAGLLMLSNDATGVAQVITFWESREVADRHLEARMRLRDRITKTVGVDVRETEHYDVVLAQLGALGEATS